MPVVLLEDSGGYISVFVWLSCCFFLVANEMKQYHQSGSQEVEKSSELVSGGVRLRSLPLVLALRLGILTVLIGSGSKPTTDRKMDKNPKEGQEKNHCEAFIGALTKSAWEQ